jgi:hypothetical protein
MVSFTTRSLYPGEGAPGTHSTGGWVDPRFGEDKIFTLPRLELRPFNRQVGKLKNPPYRDNVMTILNNMRTTFLTRRSFQSWVVCLSQGVCHQEAIPQNKEETKNKHKCGEYYVLAYGAM